MTATGYLALASEFPGHWSSRAACGDRRDDLFFPTGTTGPAEAQTQAAKALCARCPVCQECLQWALDTAQDHGVWGGLAEEERRRMRRRPGRELAHGLAYRYDQGCRCRPCTDAKSAAVRKWNKTRKERAS